MDPEQRSIPAAELRREAEARLLSQQAARGKLASEADRERLLHELEVHQIELEMQNDELQEARARAEQGREHYFELFDLAPIGYLRLSAEGLIHEANLASADLLGDVRAALVGRSFPFFVHENSRAALAAMLTQVFATEGRQVCEIELSGSGAPIFVELTATLVPGQRECLVGVADVTARRRAEGVRDSLEAQLRQSQKLEAIGQLAGGIAHDFNNLLTVIMANTSMLRAGVPRPEQVRHLLAEIDAAGERAAGLTRQLLLFSRRQTPDLRNLDLNDLIDRMGGILRRIIGEQISLEIHHELPPQIVHADSGMIDQVLLNLAVNARTAMPGDGHLIIRTSSVSLDDEAARHRANARTGDFCCLSVIDDGCGMTREVQDRMFEPYYTTKGVGQGSGLGLPTVLGIVQQHHGWIEVASEPGRGTAVHILLPRSAGSPNQTKKPVEPRVTEGRGETIFVVDDELMLRRALVFGLETFGYRILQSESGAAALDLWPEIRDEVDLLLTDVIMPGGVDGPTLVRKLREDHPQLKVILMSGYDFKLAEDRASLGADVGFIPKPFVMSEVLRILREQLDVASTPSPENGREGSAA